ncbi:MAG: ABC transporter ATP-binding protein [Planctomycetaceae bacterium]|nr:ABC transporter ATP-binding protein [Planctomycetaceae bacterium]
MTTPESMVSATDSAPATGVENEADIHMVATGLAQCALHLGVAQELVSIQRMVAEVALCWPGPLADNWWKWLVEAGRSLKLDLRVSDVQSRDLVPILTSGAVVLTKAGDGQTLVELKRSGRRGFVARRQDGNPATADLPFQNGLLRVVIGHAAHPPGEHDSHAHPKPFALLWKLLQPEQKDILTVIAISSVAGLLMLSVPVTAQQLVRTVTFATLYQPIVILSLILLGLLGFVAALQTLQAYVAELIQRRLLIRVAGTVARHLPRVAPQTWQRTHVPEVMNRFLEIVVIQKVVASLLVDGIGIVLTTVIGMSVMAFYHPFLLGYDVVLLGFLALAVFGLGRRGVQTAILESKAKYRVLAWLESIAQSPSIFQSFGVDALACDRADVLCAQYLQQRRAHFRILLRQVVMILFIQVVATTALLGLGGYLVLQEQLTLGQLIAAELIVAMIVASFAKLGKHIEGWYDLLAAVDKLAHLTDLPLQSSGGIVGVSRKGPARLAIRLRDRTGSAPGSDEKSTDAAESTDETNVLIEPGGMVALWNWDEKVLESIRQAFAGSRSREAWMVTVDGSDLADFRPDLVAAHVAVACRQEFLSGTIAENIHLHRLGITDADVLRALDIVGLTEEFQQTQISYTDVMQPSGWPLSFSQALRVVLARTLIGRPRALVIDGLFDLMGDNDLRDCVSRLAIIAADTTVVIITNQVRVASLIPRIAHPQAQVQFPAVDKVLAAAKATAATPSSGS